MAAFFGQAGQPGAAAGALPIATEATAAAGQATADGEAKTEDRTELDPDEQGQAAAGVDLNLALLALVSPVLPTQVQITAAGTETAGGASSASGAPNMPTPGPDANAAAFMGQDGPGALLTPAQTKTQGAPGLAELAKSATPQAAEPAKAAPAPTEQPVSQAADLTSEQATAQTTPSAEAAAADAAAELAAPAPPAARADAKPAPKPTRSEKTQAAQAGSAAAAAPPPRTGGAAPAGASDLTSNDAKSDEAALAPAAGAAESKPRAPEPAMTSSDLNPAPAQTRDSAATPTHTASVRGSPETVAHLAAQIVKKLDSRSTRFDLELNPAGLGRVDVRIEIGAQGQVAAALSCDNPQAAAELKARAAELQRTLEQAGFDLSGGLSFDLAADQGGSGRGAWAQPDSDNGRAFHGRAFQSALDTAGAADTAASNAIILSRASASGVDVRI